MSRTVFRGRSLKTKITLATLAGRALAEYGFLYADVPLFSETAYLLRRNLPGATIAATPPVAACARSARRLFFTGCGWRG